MDLTWVLTALPIILFPAGILVGLRWFRSPSRRQVDPFLDRVINTMPDPFYVKDPAGRFTIINDAFCALAGLARRDILFREAGTIFPGRAGAASLKKDAMAQKTLKDGVERLLLQDVPGLKVVEAV